MDRTIQYSQEQARTFDFLSAYKDALRAVAFLEQDLTGTTTGVVSGLAATPTGPATLTINIGAGRIYQLSATDGTSYGSLASDSSTIMQQGIAAAQQLTFTTAGLAGGQSRWALVQAQFSQADAVRAGDPTGGLLFYFNSANPSQPLQGPGGNLAVQNTVRQGAIVINIIYGTVATTGSEVPPNPTAGFVPLYLVDLTFGQTQVTAPQILVAGPSVGTGVPSNYPGAPFMAGLLNSHHNGAAGQAPKIILTSAAEVQGVLPAANQAGRPTINLAGTSTTYTNAQLNNQVNRSNSGAFMSDTLPAGPALTATGIITIANTDASAMLLIAPAGGATLTGGNWSGGYMLLGPGQNVSFLSDGTNYFAFGGSFRATLGANTTIFVSTTGSDTANSGMTVGSPFLTIQKAWGTVIAHLDLNGFVLTIQLANGTYTAGLNAASQALGALGPQSVVFNGSATPSNVTISVTSANCFQSATGAAFTVQGMTLTGTGASNGLFAVNGGNIAFSNIAFASMGTGSHLSSGAASVITATGNYSINGGAGFHGNTSANGSITLANQTVTLSGTPGFTGAFVQATFNAVISAANMTFSGTGATGTRFNVTANAVISNGAGVATPNYFPGNAAGTTATGGQYIQ